MARPDIRIVDSAIYLDKELIALILPNVACIAIERFEKLLEAATNTDAFIENVESSMRDAIEHIIKEAIDKLSDAL